jgi:hypothetical protein
MAAGAIVPDEQAADFIGTPDDERERDDDGELGGGERFGAEDSVHRGQVDQRGGERQRDGDTG